MRDLFDRWERVWHEGQYDLVPSCVGQVYIRSWRALLVGGRRSGRCVCIGDLHRNEHRRGRQFLLLATQNTPGDAIAACDLSLA
jgi:hypothetical protein